MIFTIYKAQIKIKCSFVSMSRSGVHMKTYKVIIMMLILSFSLSPCSVKRNILDIFDIQYISGLNKVKTTSAPITNCDGSAITTRFSASKTIIRLSDKDIFLARHVQSNRERNLSFNKYSGYTSGNCPPKYILFKRLRINLI